MAKFFYSCTTGGKTLYYTNLKKLCMKYGITYSSAHYALRRVDRDFYEVDGKLIRKHVMN